MKALKIIASGNYQKADKELVDFDNVTGIIPFCSENMILSCVKYRYAIRWISEAGYKEKVSRVRVCNIDSFEEVEQDFSFSGKDIKEMSYEELQDLAVCKSLRSVPLYKNASRQETQLRAYVEYSTSILGKDVGYLDGDKWMTPKTEGFKFAKLPPLFVDGETIIEIPVTETLDDAMKRKADGKPETITELKNIARSRGVPISGNISYDTLYKRLYG